MHHFRAAKYQLIKQKCCSCVRACLLYTLNLIFLEHFIPMTNPIGMRCITEMSHRPACVTGGLRHLYLFVQTVVCNHKAWHAFPWQSRLTSNKTLLAIVCTRTRTRRHTHIHTVAKASIKFTYGWYHYHYRSLELKGEIWKWEGRLSCPGEKRSREWMSGPGRCW